LLIFLTAKPLNGNAVEILTDLFFLLNLPWVLFVNRYLILLNVLVNLFHMEN